MHGGSEMMLCVAHQRAQPAQRIHSLKLITIQGHLVSFACTVCMACMAVTLLRTTGTWYMACMVVLVCPHCLQGGAAGSAVAAAGPVFSLATIYKGY